MCTSNSAIVPFVVALFLTLTGCGAGEDGVIGTGFTVVGAANKGPFQKDSEVKVSVLDNMCSIVAWRSHKATVSRSE